jgi:hypothetical protein
MIFEVMMGYLLAGLIWGIGTAFGGIEQKIAWQTSSLLLTLYILVIFPNKTSWKIYDKKFLMFVYIFVMTSIISWILNGGNSAGLFRYIALLPAAAIFVKVTNDRMADEFSDGLMISGILYIFFNLYFIDFGGFFDAAHRMVTPISGTNSIAFINIMVILKMLVYLKERKYEKTFKRIIIVAVIIGLIELFATKSRTAFVALLGGVLILGWNWMRDAKLTGKIMAWLFIVGGFLFLLNRWGYIYGAATNYRDFSNGNGRLNTWEYVFCQVLPGKIALGIGPGNNYSALERSGVSPSIDNGYLAIISEVGILGIIPVIVLFVISLKRALSWQKETSRLWIVLFVAGLIEALAENMLISIGNPGSLLFMLSLAQLTQMS